MKERVKAMLAADPALVECRGRLGTPLYIAARWGLATLAEILIDAGADARAVDPHGATTLDLARKYNHTDIVRLLETAVQSQANRKT